MKIYVIHVKPARERTKQARFTNTLTRNRAGKVTPALGVREATATSRCLPTGPGRMLVTRGCTRLCSEGSHNTRMDLQDDTWTKCCGCQPFYRKTRAAIWIHLAGPAESYIQYALTRIKVNVGMGHLSVVTMADQLKHISSETSQLWKVLVHAASDSFGIYVLRLWTLFSKITWPDLDSQLFRSKI